MSTKNKRRKQKPAAAVERMERFIDNILSGVITGLILALLAKWFKL